MNFLVVGTLGAVYMLLVIEKVRDNLSKRDVNAFAQSFAVEKRGFYDEVCE